MSASGSLVDAISHHLALVAYFVSIIAGILAAINGIIEYRHKRHQQKLDDVEAERILIAEEKRKESAVCTKRRRIGDCPKSTFSVKED